MAKQQNVAPPFISGSTEGFFPYVATGKAGGHKLQIDEKTSAMIGQRLCTVKFKAKDDAMAAAICAQLEKDLRVEKFTFKKEGAAE